MYADIRGTFCTAPDAMVLRGTRAWEIGYCVASTLGQTWDEPVSQVIGTQSIAGGLYVSGSAGWSGFANKSGFAS